MSYTRIYRLDLIDSATGRTLDTYPDSQRAEAQRQAGRLSIEITGGRNCTRVAVCAVPVSVRPQLEECAA